MIGVARNVAAIAASEDIAPRDLMATYARLRFRRALDGRSRTGEILGRRVHCDNVAALVALFEEIYVRRHYPFSPRRADPYVIDCGANVGVATMFFKTVAPAARVVAFEPLPAAADLYEKNIGWADRVDLVRAAVAGDAGAARLRVPPPGGEGGATISLAEAAGWQEIEVPTVKLSSYVDRPVDFLKLDVEGSEFEVLEELSAAGVLPLVSELALEYHPTEQWKLPTLLTLLADAGFSYRFASVVDAFWDDHPHRPFLIHACRVV